jgi:hypothetical protein
MGNTIDTGVALANVETQNALSARVSQLALASITPPTQGLLMRMFADPSLLEKEERVSLVEQLRVRVDEYPQVSELRVLLGMALCVNFEVHPAINELNESVKLAPNSFIAQLKLGELWMRLRVITKAEEHTRLAALLAQNFAQSDLARKQAATIRTMKREGIERGGYKTPWNYIVRPLQRLWTRNREATVALDVT